ncbi:hypothetical protein GCM10020000_75520 [Streptomyces olivoverticillatus]
MRALRYGPLGEDLPQAAGAAQREEGDGVGARLGQGAGHGRAVAGEGGLGEVDGRGGQPRQLPGQGAHRAEQGALQRGARGQRPAVGRGQSRGQEADLGVDGRLAQNLGGRQQGGEPAAQRAGAVGVLGPACAADQQGHGQRPPARRGHRSGQPLAVGALSGDGVQCAVRQPQARGHGGRCAGRAGRG